MNYRHAFHAGNPADCFKHAILLALLAHLRRKDAPFAVLDTHAGTGLTPLNGADAARTGEWRDGVGRLLEAGPALPPSLLPFRDALRAAGLDRHAYPGSPLLALGAMRAGDRLLACELHPDDADALRRHAGTDGRASIHRRDGYAAVRALLPPAAPHRRGLVLLDPPFERDDEWLLLAKALPEARARLPGGIVLAWYPVKGRAPVRAFHQEIAASGLRDVLVVEFLLRPPLDAKRLNGSGLVVVAPPWDFAERVRTLLDDLLAVLAPEGGGAWRLERIAPE